MYRLRKVGERFKLCQANNILGATWYNIVFDYVINILVAIWQTNFLLAKLVHLFRPKAYDNFFFYSHCFSVFLYKIYHSIRYVINYL